MAAEDKSSAEFTPEFFEEIDKLWDDYKIDELRSKFNGYEETENEEILWRLARVVLEQYTIAGKNASCKDLLYTSYELIKKALGKTDTNAQIHKWYVIILDAVGELEGNKVRITNSYSCHEHLLKALELNPNDATTYHSLGIWCFLFADMNWVTRKLAGAIFAAPPTSTYEDALKNFLKAEEIDPGFYLHNQVMIGTVYVRMKNKEAAIPYLKKAVETPVKVEDDKKAIKEATDLLKSCGIKV